MINKKTILKNILTSASTLAITLTASDAMATGGADRAFARALTPRAEKATPATKKPYFTNFINPLFSTTITHADTPPRIVETNLDDAFAEPGLLPHTPTTPTSQSRFILDDSAIGTGGSSHATSTPVRLGTPPLAPDLDESGLDTTLHAENTSAIVAAIAPTGWTDTSSAENPLAHTYDVNDATDNSTTSGARDIISFTPQSTIEATAATARLAATITNTTKVLAAKINTFKAATTKTPASVGTGFDALTAELAKAQQDQADEEVAFVDLDGINEVAAPVADDEVAFVGLEGIDNAVIATGGIPIVPTPAAKADDEVAFVGLDGIDNAVIATGGIPIVPTPAAKADDEIEFVGLDGIDNAVNATIVYNAHIANNKNIGNKPSNKKAISKAPRAIEDTAEALHTALDTIAKRTATMSSIIHAATAASTETASAEGIAAGSGLEKFGVWGQVMGGVANQKARKDAAGFKSHMIGGMIGADTMINDNTIIGLSFANVINNVKHKNANAGDKTRSLSLVATAYGNYKFDNDFFIRGAAAYSNTAVDNKDKRGTVVARGKYHINSFGGEVAVGKIFTLANNVLVTPSIGARFARTGKISYKETGAVALGNKVLQKASNSAMGIAGLQIAKSFATNGLTITPELHANVAYGLGVKAPAGKFTSAAGTTTSYRGDKPSRFDSTVGFGITAESGSFEYGVAYDANISAGYLGHQGSLKLKVKF